MTVHQCHTCGSAYNDAVFQCTGDATTCELPRSSLGNAGATLFPKAEVVDELRDAFADARARMSVVGENLCPSCGAYWPCEHR